MNQTAQTAEKQEPEVETSEKPAANIVEVPIRAKPRTRTGGQIMPLIPTTIDECWQMSKYFSASSVCPKGYPGRAGDNENIAAIFGAIQAGATVGIPPIAALAVMMIVNGRYAMYGDGQLSVVMDSGQLEYKKESFEGTEPENSVVDFRDDFKAVCMVKRRGSDEIRAEFSVGDAKRAELWTKKGPWKTHPKRMLKYRARAFALRDEFPDILLGLQHSAEELIDGGDLIQNNDGSYGPAAPPAPPSREDFQETVTVELFVLTDEFGNEQGQFETPELFIDAAIDYLAKVSTANGALQAYYEHNEAELERLGSTRESELRQRFNMALNDRKAAVAKEHQETDGEGQSETVSDTIEGEREG